MDKPTCRTCRHYRAREKGEPKSCHSPHLHFGQRDWNDEGDEFIIDDKTKEPVAPADAGLLDGSGYFAALYPGPDFGCVHHEPPSSPAHRV